METFNVEESFSQRHVDALCSKSRTTHEQMTLHALAAARVMTMKLSSSSNALKRRAGGLVAVVYVSEGKDADAVNVLQTVAEKACQQHGTRVLNVFRDDEYNRTGFTLGVGVASVAGHATPSVEPLKQSALALTEQALKTIDLRNHSATHPRCGAVDHISCHAVGDAPDDLAAQLAKCLGEGIGDRLKVPVLLYGLASSTGTQLADLRRKYGYFRRTSQDVGWSGAHRVGDGQVEADYGPSTIPPESGILMLGATRWVCNYNVPIVLGKCGVDADAADALAVARRLARQLSERGGGLPGVQAMALTHMIDAMGSTIEVACNLLDPSTCGPDAVQAEVERLFGEEGEFGWTVKRGYVTNLTPEDMLQQLVPLR